MNYDLRHIDSVLDFIEEKSVLSKDELIYYILRKCLFILQEETGMKHVTDREITEYLELGLNYEYFYKHLKFFYGEEFNLGILVDYFNSHIEEILHELQINLSTIDSSELKIIFYHATSTVEDSSEVENYGLLDLRKVLTLNTPLKRFLLENEIEIDFCNRTLNYQGNELISFDNAKIDKTVRKLERDYQINGILCPTNCDEGYYIGEKHYIIYPEFLSTLDSEMKTDLCEKWKKESKGLLIRCSVRLKDIFSFYSIDFDRSSTEGNLLNNEREILKNLFALAFSRVICGHRESIINLKSGVEIQPKDLKVIGLKKIEERLEYFPEDILLA